MICFSCTLLLATVSSVLTFNLRYTNQSVSGPNAVPGGSFFGYALAAVGPTNGPDRQMRLLVGAPAEDSFNGAVYTCNMNGQQPNVDKLNFGCSRLNDPILSRARGAAGRWLGATVVSDEGSILVCAPRTNRSGGTLDYHLLQGQCFYKADGAASFQSYSGYDEGLCQQGFSATMVQRGPTKKVLTGAPSCIFYQNRRSRGGVWITDDFNLRLASDTAFDNLYKGFSLAAHNQYVAVSVSLHIESAFAGKVYVRNVDTMTPVGDLTGSQPGEHFGASLLIADVDADGKDDIIIGAPHHSNYNNSEVEVGAVYVYRAINGRFRKSDNSAEELVLIGRQPKGRFGHALASLGDVNRDGYSDVAVGAPYENSFGTVYIYHGSKLGLKSEPSQAISGSLFNPAIRSFGYTLTAGDFDGNGYSDLVVGAYQSDAIVYIPAIPVVKVSSTLEFTSKIADLKTSPCYARRDGGNGVIANGDLCEIKYCLNYTGFNIPNSLQFNVSVTMDADAGPDHQRRVLFLKTKGVHTWQVRNVEYGKLMCLSDKLYVRYDESDSLLTVHDAQMTIRLMPSEHQVVLDAGSVSVTSVNMFPVPAHEMEPQSIPWWIYVVSILGALLVIATVVGVLYKFGFFKRKLPPNDQNNQELTPVEQQTAS